MNIELSLLNIVELLTLGGLASFAAGMFGIGGGLIVIPGLTFIFNSLGMNYETSIRAAIATSMVNMLFVSSGSVLANKKLNLIIWSVFYQALIPIILGVLTGLFISTSISGKLLNLIFGIFLALVAIKMIYDSINYKKNLRTEILNEYNIKILIVSMFFIGIIAGILGLGAGFAVVPFLVYFCLPIKEATGTSSAVSFVVSLTGAIFYLTNKSIGGVESSYFIGYVFWLGILIMLPTSFLLANFGAKVKKKMHDNKLTIVFSIILTYVSIKMIYPNLKELLWK
jgi:uncharacterized membrane protein YfcA